MNNKYRVYRPDQKQFGGEQAIRSIDSNIKPNDDEWLRGISCFIINENGKILIEKRSNTELTPLKIDLCSGHIDNSELPYQALQRELKEELNISIKDCLKCKKIKDAYPLQFESEGRKNNFYIYFYYIKVRSKQITDIKLQKNEVSSIEWVDIEKLRQIFENGETKFPYNNNKEFFSDMLNNLKTIIETKDSRKEGVDR